MLKKFKQYLVDLGYSPATYSGYLYDLSYLIKAQITDEKLTFFDDNKFLSQQVNPKTKHRQICSLKKYIKFLTKEKIVVPDFLTTLELPKIKQNLASITTENHIKNLLQNETNLEIKLILTILFTTGCRIKSLVNLKVKDISKQTITFATAKRDKPYISVISESVYNLAQKYILENNRTNYLFLDSSGHPLSSNALRMRLKRHLGVNYINPHKIRHTIATILISNGAELIYVKDFLNHSSIATTQKYIHLSAEQKNKHIKEFHPMLCD